MLRKQDMLPLVNIKHAVSLPVSVWLLCAPAEGLHNTVYTNKSCDRFSVFKLQR